MIKADKRKAIYCLYEEGLGIREISRRLKVSRNTVSKIIALKGTMPEPKRKDRIQIDVDRLGRLHTECKGWIQRRATFFLAARLRVLKI